VKRKAWIDMTPEERVEQEIADLRAALVSRSADIQRLREAMCRMASTFREPPASHADVDSLCHVLPQALEAHLALTADEREAAALRRLMWERHTSAAARIQRDKARDALRDAYPRALQAAADVVSGVEPHELVGLASSDLMERLCGIANDILALTEEDIDALDAAQREDAA